MEAAADVLASGDVSRWCPDALPAFDGYHRVLLRTFFDLAGVYLADAKRRGFARFGSKLPSYAPNHVKVLAQMFPGSRHVFVYRHLEAVLRSYKARKWVRSPADIARICVEWNQGMNDARTHAGDLELVCYEHLLEDPERHCGRIAEVLGVGPLDRAAFEHKVNTWCADAPERGVSLDQYVEPEALTPRELALMRELSGEALALSGYALE